MCIDEILQNNSEQMSWISELKRASDYYPVVARVEHPFPTGGFKEFSFTTLVRVKRDGKWYTVHCVEDFINNDSDAERITLLRFMIQVHNIQNLYMITGKCEDVDELQISEEDRITDLFKKRGL